LAMASLLEIVRVAWPQYTGFGGPGGLEDCPDPK
jgi:hypothetical protein